MYTIRKSTAATVPIFAHDVSGDPVLGLLTGDWTWRISKNSGAYGAMTVTTTEMEGGWYSLGLTTGHSDTVGILSIYGTHASCKQVNLQFRVETRLVDEVAFPTISGRSLDVSAAGNAGLDFSNYEGTLPKGSVLTGFNDLSAAEVATAAQAGASLALATYDAPSDAEMLAVVRAHSASLALAAYDPPTNTELTAAMAALNDLSTADVLAGVIDGAATLQDVLARTEAYCPRRVSATGNAYTYYATDGSTPLFTLTASTTMRATSL